MFYASSIQKWLQTIWHSGFKELVVDKVGKLINTQSQSLNYRRICVGVEEKIREYRNIVERKLYLI